MLKIAVPKGSLEEGTFELFEQAGLKINRADDRSYKLFVNDPRISETLMLRPQEIAGYVAEGEFDLGITGFDWVVEEEANVKDILDVQFSKRGFGKVKIVLATDENNPVNSIEEISIASRVVTEYPVITRRYFRKFGKGKVKIRLSFGATEIKVPRLAEYLVDVTETGETLRKNGKKIVEVIMESSTKLIANPESWKNQEKRKAIEDIKTLLSSAIDARSRVLIKMNVPKGKLDELLAYLPSMKSPAVTRLYCLSGKEKWFSVETAVKKLELNVIIPRVKEIGARDIIELDILKII